MSWETRTTRKTHGKSDTCLYGIWKAMKRRCYNKNCHAYKDYGGRGIIVCQEWKTCFETFHRDMGEKPDGLSLDRIDNEGNYEPNNCRWATPRQQGKNMRSNLLITIRGKEHTLSEWSRISGVKVGTLWKRWASGWRGEKLLTKPCRRKGFV